MIITERYKYTTIQQKNSPKGRQYICPDGLPVPSVTTILSQTKSAEDMAGLNRWKKRVGKDNAQRIVTEAGNRGTSMHKKIEEYLLGIDNEVGSNTIHQQTSKMANLIIDKYLEPNLTEVWGSEVRLYYTGLYAGTTDCVGLWKGKPAIVDFKQSNKPKKLEWITDYLLQLVAYAHAHNHVHDTNIRNGVVLMCTPDLQPQCFELTDDIFDSVSDQWWERVKKFHVG